MNKHIYNTYVEVTLKAELLNHSKMHLKMATATEKKCKLTQPINYGQLSNYQHCVKS
jgi:hypothetical protein